MLLPAKLPAFQNLINEKFTFLANINSALFSRSSLIQGAQKYLPKLTLNCSG